MSHKRKPQYPGLQQKLETYAKDRVLDIHQYSPYHFRLMDGGYTVLDVWTTGRYYIMTTDYMELGGSGIIERGGEKGMLPSMDLDAFLDKIFFAVTEKTT